MRKSMKSEPENQGRVLARVLAEDLRRVQGGAGYKRKAMSDTNTVTELGERLDITFRGGDGDFY